jgi:hypothetical protein
MNPPQNIPCGGGVNFVNNFIKFLISNGDSVEFRLNAENPPDILFMLDTRILEYSNNWLSFKKLNELQTNHNLNCPIVYRINDIGFPKERPKEFVKDNVSLGMIADHIIYVSDFVKRYYKEIKNPNNTVIPNGVEKDVFPFKNYSFNRIDLITHHWSTNFMKGWDIYPLVDDFIKNRDDISFTYLGNLPPDISLPNSNVIKPSSYSSIAKQLRCCNTYLTASRHEPCGNHYLEGLACGLPLLFHEDGGGVEDVSKFGISYSNFNDLKNIFESLVDHHKSLYDKIKSEFNYYTSNTFKSYYKIFQELV